MSINELEAKVKELLEIRAQIEELEAEKTALEDILKMAMADAGRDEMKAGCYSLSWKTITSRRFDASSFKKDHADLAEQYTRETRTCRFLVK